MTMYDHATKLIVLSKAKTVTGDNDKIKDGRQTEAGRHVKTN